MVIDTSALLAVFFNEPQAEKIADILSNARVALRMSTVNLAETFILLEDRQPQLADEMKRRVLESNIRFVAPSIQQAVIAGHARLQYPLNLGDCFAYALAKSEQCEILTLDEGFRKTDLKLVPVR